MNTRHVFDQIEVETKALALIDFDLKKNPVDYIS